MLDRPSLPAMRPNRATTDSMCRNAFRLLLFRRSFAGNVWLKDVEGCIAASPRANGWFRGRNYGHYSSITYLWVHFFGFVSWTNAHDDLERLSATQRDTSTGFLASCRRCGH